MKGVQLGLLYLSVALLGGGCGTYQRRGVDAARAQALEAQLARRVAELPADKWKCILALDPNHVSEKDIRETLAGTPAPRLIMIHGGVDHVIPWMVSFADFLQGMGYPGPSLTNAADGTYTFSCYESSRIVAGSIAWYYEKEGLRPMMMGHSQGAFQIVKVLDLLQAGQSRKVPVWNPLTWKSEQRCAIRDPMTGQPEPVVGLRLPYVSGVGGGGLTRLLPNQWAMCGRLRTIPDSVEEFTYFYKGMDLLGGDFLGYGPANLAHPRNGGSVEVRNVRLPTWYRHGAIPDTRHLLAERCLRDWINDYDPAHPPAFVPEFEADARNILWAADVWHSIKKHWVLELQRWIRAREAEPNAR